MARPPRLEIAHGIYHVTARGNERRAIYRADPDRRHFLELLAEVSGALRWRVLCYCLMSNHYHLLVETPEPNLARGMRQLNGVYAQAFNRRHARVGHLLQGRYGARLVQTDGHVLEVARYIVRNPVRAGLCAHPEEWRWSSHRATLGEAPSWFVDTSRLLSFYGPDRESAHSQYRSHTEDKREQAAARHPLVEGEASFIVHTLHGLEPAPGIPRRYLRAPAPPLDTLLRSGAADAIAAAHEHGYSLRQIARHLGVNVSTVSRRLQRQGGRRDATART